MYSDKMGCDRNEKGGLIRKIETNLNCAIQSHPSLIQNFNDYNHWKQNVDSNKFIISQ